MIPKRFTNEVHAHLLGNYLRIPRYPLILAIMGKPGMGKTWQLRTYLKGRQVEIHSVSAADLESSVAGMPARVLRDQYVNAAMNIGHSKPSALIVDDIDTTVGEWSKNTGTVNHQHILALLMHLADSPEFIEGIGEVKRVPIFITGNNFDLLYEPLRRPERTARFDWVPDKSEMIDVVSSIFNIDKVRAKKLVSTYPEESVAFFADLFSSHNRIYLTEIIGNTEFSKVLSNEKYRCQIVSEYEKYTSNTNWLLELCRKEAKNE